MIKILSVVLLFAAIASAQIPSFDGQGGKLKTDAATGVVSSTAISLSASDGSGGTLRLTLPSVPIADLENGGCFPSGGAFTLKLTGPTVLTLSGTLGSNSGTCPDGPQWQLGYEGPNTWTYTLAVGLSDGSIQGYCELRTRYLPSLWDGSAPIQNIDCSFN